MSVEKRFKSKSVTNDQKSAMVDFMKNHEELAKGKHSSTFTQAIARQQWEELSGVLNSIPGPIKDWKAWRRTWQDLKADAKKKQAQINKNLKGTGGGPSTAGSLDSLSETVVGMIGVVPISGDPLITDYPICFDFDSPNR
ncbi:uncharacterized protein LOC126554567 [Aphis gossypii]|uniref:uncharacterized protein LOC126554567 n=1 Tax=Aphis gossypii TaxID=80765 RepID=UPI002158CFE7|nr:uncharacterized protein LOC126554567 [Aphis gossypii]